MANALTLSRLLLTPFFILFFQMGQNGGNFGWVLAGQIGALLIAVSFEVTDILDGVVARRTGQVTDLGKVADPLADSISRFTVFLCFLMAGYADVWAVAVIFWRDSIIATLRGVAAKNGIALAARASGKIKAIVQGTAIITICSMEIIDTTARRMDVQEISLLLMWVVVATTAWSLYDYCWACRAMIKAVWSGNPVQAGEKTLKDEG